MPDTTAPEKRDILEPLSERELASVPSLTEEIIAKALEEGRRIRDETEARTKNTPAIPKIQFRSP